MNAHIIFHTNPANTGNMVDAVARRLHLVVAYGSKMRFTYFTTHVCARVYIEHNAAADSLVCGCRWATMACTSREHGHSFQNIAKSISWYRRAQHVLVWVAPRLMLVACSLAPLSRVDNVFPLLAMCASARDHVSSRFTCIIRDAIDRPLHI